jgi:type VI secretion system secreted protein Hcp
MKKAIWLGSVLVLLSTTSTALAETVFMTVKAAKQGDIKGGVTQKGKEGAMQCSGFQSQLLVPRDSATGKASGRLQIDPVKCVKRIDRASPMLVNALLSNEALTDVTFSFSQPSGGAEAVVYTMSLKNATVAGVRQFLDPAGLAQEEVTIAYQQATVTFVQGGVTAEISR